MKIFDCFPFFNELDQLEFRLKFLDKHVDHFVIAESNLTHSGHTKPYYFGESRDRFKRWEDKIIYIRVQQSRDGLVFEEQKSYDPSSASWKLEFEQRNALLEAASYMEDTDMVLLGDLDEVPFPPAIKKAVNTRKPVAFSLLFHVHYLNCQHAKELRWWQGCIAATAKQFREISPQGLRDNRDVYPSLPDAGWHFSYMGGPERIRQKLLAFAHTEYSGEEFSNEEHIIDAVSGGKDLLNREGFAIKYVPLNYYPLALQRIMKQYPQLLSVEKTHPLSGLYYTLRRIIRGKY